MKGTIADLKFVRYGDMVVPVIMGKERRRVINSIVPQGLNQYVNNLVTVSNTAQAFTSSSTPSPSGWGSSPSNAILLLNNGTTVQTLSTTVIPVLNGSTVIWVFIASDLSSASYTANQVNLFVTVNFAFYIYGGGIFYSPPFNLATATTSIVKQSGETISFVWEIQVNLGSSALTDFILGVLYSIPVIQTSCGGSTVQLGTFGGIYKINDGVPYYFYQIELQYVGGSTSANIASITTTYDGTNTYLIMTASITLSSQVTATGIVVNVIPAGGTINFFCINGQQVNSGSVIQIPYNATLSPGTINITVTIEFSPAT